MAGALVEKTPTHGSVRMQWRTTLFNCDCHTFEQVEAQLMAATGCSLGRARELAWKAHSEGLVCVFEGPREQCRRVAEVLGEIGLRATVQS